MECKMSSFFAYAFCFMFFSFLAVHYAHMKTPSLDRSIASHKYEVVPWYQASFKY